MDAAAEKDNSVAPPRFKADATIKPFDVDADSSCTDSSRTDSIRYVVSLGPRHFVIGATMAELLLATRDARSYEELSEQLSHRMARPVSVDEVKSILFHPSTRPLLFDDEQPRSCDPLKLRFELLSTEVLSPILAVLSGLFTASWAITLVIAFVTIDVWVAFTASSLSTFKLSGLSLALSTVGILFGMGVHELGHVAACHRFKGRYGGIGVGLYWIFPTFYADVRDAWTLSRKHRAVVDIGGAYFQCIYLLLIGCLQIVYPSPVFLSILAVSHFLLLHTLNPVLKFDGYWLISDLTGAFNLHDRIRDSARRLWHWRTNSATPIPLPTRLELFQLGAFVLMSSAFFGYTIFVLLHAINMLGINALHRIEENNWTATTFTTTALTLACICVLALALIMLVRKLINGLSTVVKVKHLEA